VAGGGIIRPLPLQKLSRQQSQQRLGAATVNSSSYRVSPCLIPAPHFSWFDLGDRDHRACAVFFQVEPPVPPSDSGAGHNA
jgi:hypothetical protein